MKNVIDRMNISVVSFVKVQHSPLLVEKILLAKNYLHVMKRILYDTGPRVVARWSRERILKLSYSVLVKRPHNPLKMKKISLSQNVF